MSPVSVLIADDTASLRHLLTRTLAGHFHVLQAVVDGEELVDRAHELNPDVIVSDVTMPALTGIEALRVLKGMGCRAKFVLTSADAALAADCLAAGADAFVPKDRVCELLVPAVAAILSPLATCGSGGATASRC